MLKLTSSSVTFGASRCARATLLVAVTEFSLRGFEMHALPIDDLRSVQLINFMKCSGSFSKCEHFRRVLRPALHPLLRVLGVRLFNRGVAQGAAY